MKKSNAYWAKRKLARMDEYHKDSDKVIGKVLEAYQDSISDIEEQMRNILKTLAHRARLTRLQAMKEKLNIECKKLADIQVKEIEKGLINIAYQAYYKTIFDMQQLTGIGFSFAEIPTKQIEEILKNNWSGKHYSKRIWRNTDVLASELEYTLTKGFMTGASVDRMVKEISDKMQVGKFAATRLIRTETTYVANSAELEAYKEAGVEKLMFLATLDLRTSDICRQHDKKIIPVDKAIPGVNIPPLHANCRSTTLEVFREDNLVELQRRARDPVTGENKTVPANMDYNQWYKDNIINNKMMTLNRRTKNIGSFNKLKELMQIKHIKKVAKEADIDLNGIKIKIQRDKTLLNTPFAGSAAPEQIGRIDLFPNAFIDREQLLRTLVHEKVHVEQYRKYGSSYVMNNRQIFEKEAEKIEEEWYNNYKKRGGKIN